MAGEGTVHLVGAGPGGAELITALGLRRLKEAEVVVYDRLVNPSLLTHAPEEAERICVGKGPNAKGPPQEQINQLLIERARAGKRVVRLKGGDPFIFSRGGEEALALARAGIPFEVVPGVTAANGALATAGIPLTHRGRASLAVLVTAHEDPTKGGSDVDWQLLARLRGTLVFYMTVGRLEVVVETLIGNGRDPATPAAVIQNGTLPSQRVLRGNLGDIVERASSAGVQPPALLVVGEVVELRDSLNWFERKPLFGRTVVVTRPEGRAASLTRDLADLGAEVLELPTIRIEPPPDTRGLDAAIDHLDTFDWLIFTSANGVRSFFDRLLARTRDARALSGLQLAAIGPATAQAIHAHGLITDLLPNVYTTQGLLEEFKRRVDLGGKRVLWPSSDISPPDLKEGLEEMGAEVSAVVAYRTLPAELAPPTLERLLEGKVDWVTFTSASTVRNFAAALGRDRLERLAGRVRFATIGPQTTTMVERLGLSVSAEADESTSAALIRAILAAEGAR